MKASHVFAFLGGAAVGTLATLLFATKKGEEIRNDIREQVVEATEKLTKEELTKLLELLNKGKEKLETLEDKVDDEIKDVKKELKKKK